MDDQRDEWEIYQPNADDAAGNDVTPDDTAGAARDAASANDPSPPSDDLETISLLDLMAEGLPEPEDDDTPPHPIINLPSDPDDDVTRTGPLAPPAQPPLRPRPRPRPTERARLRPSDRPSIRDDEATVVNPRAAFPGHTVVRPRTPVRDAPPAADPTQMGPPVPPRPRDPVVVPAGRPRRLPADWAGRLFRWTVIAFLLLLILFVGGVATLSLTYVSIAADLPRVDELELQSRASAFETVRIFDSSGGLLYSIADPNAGNRTYVTLDQIDDRLELATIATEDKRFYENPGFDPVALSRAIITALRERDFSAGGGASTITQQLARALLLEDEERTQQTVRRKVREIILAAEMGRTVSKEKILELYLNEIYYGNLAYGIEAAAQTYFDKPAAELSWSEATLLAGLPQAPALWDPFTNPELAIGRQKEVLELVVANGGALSLTEAQAILNDSADLIRHRLTPPEVTISHPHFTLAALRELEAIYGANNIYRGGLRVYTTLDPATQRLAEQVVREGRAALAADGANNAALVALEPTTGAVRALVGSADYRDESISGQVNMALAPRQPGSTIKPFVYLAAMEQGMTPATLLWDVPTSFPDGANPLYEPKNYDNEFHGPLLLRPSLGNSYNIPAVKALETVGVCPFITRVRDYGLPLTDTGCDSQGAPSEYGLALALGGGEVAPLDMAAAFGMLANRGQAVTPHFIARIEAYGTEVYSDAAVEPRQVVSEDDAFLISHILSDNQARQPEFAPDNRLVIAGHQVAAKTGTSGTDEFDVRDGWTIGYTPQIVTAVWVGNTDNEPVFEGRSGYGMASPLWNQFMREYLATRQPADFLRPLSVEEIAICADSGVRASDLCANQRNELFNGARLPLPADQHFIRQVPIDLWTSRVANAACPEATYDARFFNLLVSGRPEAQLRYQASIVNWLQSSAAGQRWATQRGLTFPLQSPPADSCVPGMERPIAIINQPLPNSTIAGDQIVQIGGRVGGPNVSEYRLEVGASLNPAEWEAISVGKAPFDGELAQFLAPRELPTGPIMLRLTLIGPDNPYTQGVDPVTLETRLPLTLLQPTATPTATPTPTSTPTATPTATATPTITPTASPTPTITPSPVITPTVTITPTLTITPTVTTTP